MKETPTTTMRFFILALGLLSVAKAQSQECYTYDEDGNVVYDEDGEPTVAICMCDADDLAQFIRHIGKNCFSDGQIPAEIEDGTYWGCAEDDGDGDDDNNDGDDAACDSDDDGEAAFWCSCLGSYLNTYETFPEGCLIPMLSEAMKEIGGVSMEAAWDENNCEWFDFNNVRVIPEDIEVTIGTTGSFAVTTDATSWATSMSLTLDWAEIEEAYTAATGNAIQCGDGDDDNDDDDEDGQELAWEIRTGWTYNSGDTSTVTTRYGDDCSQENTGSVFVGWAYPIEINDDGEVEGGGEAEVFSGDLTENHPLQLQNGAVYYGGDDNNNNDDDDNNSGEVAGTDLALSSALVYRLYNKYDVDGYSIVISCADEAESVEEEDNNDDDDESAEECQYGDDELCADVVLSAWANPIVCTNFFVVVDMEKTDPDALDSDNDEFQEGDDEDKNDNDIPDGEEEVNGFVLVPEAEAIAKTIAVIALGVGCLCLCLYAWKAKKSSGGYNEVDGNGQTRSGDQL